MKNEICIVKGCTNKKSQGKFIGDLCFPCYKYLTTGIIKKTNSFLKRMPNENPKKNKN